MCLFFRRFVLSITLAALSGSYFGFCTAQDSLQAVFQRMDQAALKFKGLRADMRKVSHLDLLHEDDVETGTILVRVPKPHDFQYLIDFQQPNPKKVKLSGTKAEIYFPKTNTVQEVDLGKRHKAQIEEFVLLGFGSNSRDLQRAYTVKLLGSETIGDEKTTRIELKPKNEDVSSMFPKFELWIADDSGIAVQQKAFQPGEKDYSLATYTNMKINPGITDADVKLAVPANAQREKLQK